MRVDTRLAFPLAVAVVFAGYAALVGWDVFHYDWLRGYDAYANSLYSDVIRLHHRLPHWCESRPSAVRYQLPRPS